jgi:hypothetical protein
MESDLSRAIQRLPSVVRFSERIVEDLTNGRSVIALLPFGIDPQWVVQIIHSAFFTNSIRYREYLLEGAASGKSCAVQLSETAEVVGNNGLPPWSVRSLMEAKSLPPVFILKLAGDVLSKSIAEWLCFTSEWARLAHQRSNQG